MRYSFFKQDRNTVIVYLVLVGLIVATSLLSDIFLTSRNIQNLLRQVVPIGEGDIDWRGQLTALRRDGYDGFYTIETHFRPKVAGSKACHEALARMLIEVM